jgi:hypothetical protein
MTTVEKTNQEAITPAIWKAYQEIVDQAWKERRRTMDKAERAYQEIVDQAWKAGPGREKEERCPRSYRPKRLNGNCGEASDS